MKYGFPMGRIRLGSFIEGLAFALNYYHVASNICFNWKSALAARDSICRVSGASHQGSPASSKCSLKRLSRVVGLCFEGNQFGENLAVLFVSTLPSPPPSQLFQSACISSATLAFAG